MVDSDSGPATPASGPVFDPKIFAEAKWEFGLPTPEEKKLNSVPKFDLHFRTMAKRTLTQKKTGNGSSPQELTADGTTTKGGLNPQNSEDRQCSTSDWVRSELASFGYFTSTGEPRDPISIDYIRTDLHGKRPKDTQEITAALRELHEEMVSNICERFPIKSNGRFSDVHFIANKLVDLKLEPTRKKARASVVKFEEYKGLRHYEARSLAEKSKSEDVLTIEDVKKAATRPEPIRRDQPMLPNNAPLPKSAQNDSTDESLEAWVHQQFLDFGFSAKGFKGFGKLTKNMGSVRPEQKDSIGITVAKLREPGHKYSFGDPDAIAEQKQTAAVQKNGIFGMTQAQQSIPVNPSPTMNGTGRLAPSNHVPPILETRVVPAISNTKKPANRDVLTTKLNGFRISTKSCVPSDDGYTETESSLEDSVYSGPEADALEKEISHDPSYKHIDLLMPDESCHDDTEDESTAADAEIKHAPLVSGDMITQERKRLLPQYGFFGVDTRNKSKLFLNTNVPFSAFICGVQGSGKSHTTSCLLENVLIPSQHLGRLENPLSALVFSYGHFSGDGSGFNISEVASLAAAHPSFPGHPHVKKVTVLISPSNPGIAKLYKKVPNVTVIPYKLKPWNLDIETMLTLMSVKESDEQPLYMAQVTQILRDMATNGNGMFNYGLFRKRLKECDFNPAQKSMLQLRLDLLESFLDLKNVCPEPNFEPGEITIMDMSCPFVDANTACILFRIGMQRYLQSNAPGKMIVLDEAHKYMLKNPGAVALNSSLLTLIRLQRHFGARVIISTQEPTLLTDLIALCSITVIHRFSSPEWFLALKKHIPMSGQNQDHLMRNIEGLKTGTALVYSSGAVLGKDEEGGLIKGAGKLVKVGIRKRVTSDGGQSVLAV